jgi:hypothetical protein
MQDSPSAVTPKLNAQKPGVAPAAENQAATCDGKVCHRANYRWRQLDTQCRSHRSGQFVAKMQSVGEDRLDREPREQAGAEE